MAGGRRSSFDLPLCARASERVGKTFQRGQRAIENANVTEAIGARNDLLPYYTLAAYVLECLRYNERPLPPPRVPGMG